jgi:hypothetical protein
MYFSDLPLLIGSKLRSDHAAVAMFWLVWAFSSSAAASAFIITFISHNLSSASSKQRLSARTAGTSCRT